MKQIKLFMVMLLSLVGMTAAAQQPTLVSSTATPVNETTLTTGKYLIAAGTTDIYYFNVNEGKVNVPSTKQVFTYTEDNYLQRNSDNNYVNATAYSLSAGDSGQSMTISFNSRNAARIKPALSSYYNYYIVSNGNDADAAGVSTDNSYNWYLYKAAVVTIIYYDKTNSKNIKTVTYVGRVGDELQWPTIPGYTLNDTETYTLTGSVDETYTVNYTNDNGIITKGVLPEGRYFMQNTILLEDVWMTSYKSLVSLIPDARSFWSVWVVKCVDATNNTYEIYNEGNRDVMTPCTDPKQRILTRDEGEGYLYYDKEKKGYFVGTITDDTKQFKYLTVTYDTSKGGHMIRSSEATTDYYLSFDNGWKETTDEKGNVLEGDHCLKSILSTVGNANPYWNFYAVTANDDLTLYENGVQGLNAYVGGLTTMDLPDGDVEELLAAKEVVDKYEADREILEKTTTEEAAVKYREFVEAINKMRKQNNTAVFCQNLVEGRPFWLETIGNRSGYLNRLTISGTSWTNAANVTKDTPAGTFYATVTPVTDEKTVIDPKTGDTKTYDEYYTLRNGDGNYLKSPTGNLYSNGYSIEGDWEVWSQNPNYNAGLLSGSREVTSTTDAKEALQFTIIPIVPGIYQMCDIAEKWQGDPFLTFNGEPKLHHYRVSESFSYFKFKTYNVYDYAVKQAGTDYVGSYGNILNSKINDTDITAYYIRAGKHSYNDAGDNILIENATPEEMKVDDKGWGIFWDKNATFTVYLDVVPDRNMQGMQGYILSGTKATQGKAVVNNEEAYDLKNNNMLHVALNEIYIEPDTWGNYYDIFVLAYKPQGTVIGTWHQEPVEAVGLGFYHLKRGQKLPTGRCYLSTADLCAQLKRRYPNDWDNTYFYPYPKTSTGSVAAPASDEGNQNEAGFRIVFRDSNGVQTAIEEAPIIEVDNEAELDAMSQIYSLDGRKVTTPKSGEIYILNGKKVMF